jgi:hypothetical protein
MCSAVCLLRLLIILQVSMAVCGYVMVLWYVTPVCAECDSVPSYHLSMPTVRSCIRRQHAASQSLACTVTEKQKT